MGIKALLLGLVYGRKSKERRVKKQRGATALSRCSSGYGTKYLQLAGATSTCRPIAQIEMQKTSQNKPSKPTAEQEWSVEIDMGDGNLASRRNPITEHGQRLSDSYISKMPNLQKPRGQNACGERAEKDKAAKNNADRNNAERNNAEAKGAQKEEPAALQPQARQLSAGAARLIAKRRAMMEGQDQAGSFKFPRQDQDPTESS
jgi:hypothetical protein